MKKFNVLFMAMTAFVLFSCNNATPVEEVVEEEVVVEAPATVEVEGLPKFENADLTTFTKAFDDYFDRSMEKLTAGDMEGLAAMEEEGKSLQARMDEIKKNVSESDQAILEEYLKGKAAKMLSASGLNQLGEKMEKESTK